MESKTLQKKLNEIDDAIRRLTFKVQDVARDGVRVDKDVEELALHVKKLRFPNDERLKNLDPGLDRIRKLVDSERQSARARVTGDTDL